MAWVRKNFAHETYSENIGLYIKSKQLPLTEKCICLTILSVNSVYNFSKMHLSYSLNITTDSSYFNKIASVGFQYESVSVHVNKVCFEVEQDIPNTREKSTKNN